jgi:hypothetical protein
MWPYEHPHPAQHLDHGQRTAQGLIDIAKHLGIEHGCFVGTTVPYIGSIDLMLNGAVRCGRSLSRVSVASPEQSQPTVSVPKNALS